MSHPLHCCGSDAERHAELLPQHWDRQIHCRHIPQHSRNQIPPTHVCNSGRGHSTVTLLQLLFTYKDSFTLWCPLKNGDRLILKRKHVFISTAESFGRSTSIYRYRQSTGLLHLSELHITQLRRRLGALQVCSSVFVKAACMANSWILYTCGNGTENTWIQR